MFEGWLRGMFDKLDTLDEACGLISETFNLPVFFINPIGEIIIEKTRHKALNPLYQNDKDHLFTLLKFEPKNSYHFPVIIRTIFRENFISISMLRDDKFEGTILIGPSIPHHFSDEEINGLIHDTQTPYEKTGLTSFYQSAPVIKRDKLVNISIMIFFMVNQKLLPFEKVINENRELGTVKINMGNPDIEVSKRLQGVTFHHDPLFERRLIKSIKEGRVEEVLEMIYSIPEEEFGVLSKSSYIRSKKNLVISAITIATRAAMDGGLHPEKAYTLSDVYIQRLEELNDIHQIDKLNEEALCTFARRVLKSREQCFSKTITTCQNYILNHLYEEISHTDIANLVELNPNYLSVLFKKEVGLSVGEYIQRVRIDEAKSLLSYTNTPLSEICSWLNFTDQSYFTKVFKKLVGITPKKYREQHTLLEG